MFDAPPPLVWRALCAALPVVATQGAFYEHDRRVEWTVALTGWSWTQSWSAQVDDGPGSSTTLRVANWTNYRAAIGDGGRRKKAFETLCTAVRERLDHPMTLPDDTLSSDAYRYWNGREWTPEPPG